jgi:hypothetical protein
LKPLLIIAAMVVSTLAFGAYIAIKMTNLSHVAR